MLRPLASILLAASASAQATYELREVAPPDGELVISSTSIDDRGNALLHAQAPPSAQIQLWIVGPDGSRRLTVPPGSTHPFGRDLADSGRVVGSLMDRPAVWDPEGHPRFLRTLWGAATTFVEAGNSSGLLVGTAVFYGGYEGGPVYPLAWAGDALVPLPMPGGAVRAWCEDVNEQGTIVGACALPIGPNQFRSMGWVRDAGGTITTIGWPANHFANLLTSLNNEGEAVGYALDSQFVVTGFRWNDGGFTEIPGAGILLEIGRDGTALGVINPDYPQYAEPTLCLGASAWRLQDRLDPASGAGWDLVIARDRNNAGQILCDAFDPLGRRRACILTPLAESNAAAGVARRPRTREQLASVERTLSELEARLDPGHLIPAARTPSPGPSRP